ncbi:MAG: hypothetical protein AAGD01_08055 [Acidobacteriota bacterium]
MPSLTADLHAADRHTAAPTVSHRLGLPRFGLVCFGLLCFGLFGAASSHAQYPPAPEPFFGALDGQWVGELSYQDYRNPDRRVTLPTTATVALAGPRSATLHFVFDDGIRADGTRKIVHGYERWTLDEEGQELRWESFGDEEVRSYRVLSFDEKSAAELGTEGEATYRLVAERRVAQDDGFFVERQELRLTATEVELSKFEATLSADQLDSLEERLTWRNGYLLRRAVAAP